MTLKTALIAGAAGFIGSHLSERLLKDGYRVIGVDNFITGSQENISFLKKFENFSFIGHNVNDPLDLSDPIDFVFDLACPASPYDFVELQIEIAQACSFGTYNLLNVAKKNNAVFLLASTSEVYGDPEENPQKESYNGNVYTTGIRSVYDEGKRFSESMVMAFHRKYNLPTRIVRIFNTYGERMRSDDGRVIPNFITQALQNLPLTIQGDGTQTRSIQYISDLVDGILKLTNSSVAEPINIGNPIEMTIKEIAEKIMALSGSTSELTFLPLPEHDPKLRCPDITKAKNLLSWEPKVNPDEGLKTTIEWFRNNLER